MVCNYFITFLLMKYVPSHVRKKSVVVVDRPKPKGDGDVQVQVEPIARRAVEPFFLFYIFKKQKFQKYMSVLKYFKNIPRSPPIGRQALSVIFFLQICNEVPGKKNARGPVTPPGATGSLPPI